MTRLFVLPAMVMIAVLSGCSPMSAAKSAGKVAFQTMRGAEADVTLIRGLDPAILGDYKSIQAGEVNTDVPPICNGAILAAVRKEIQEEANAKSVKKLFPGGDKAIRIDVDCRFYKKKGAIGGEGRLDWLVHLKDAASGAEVGVVFIEGLSESPLEHGADDMAEENFRQLVKFLGKRLKAKD